MITTQLKDLLKNVPALNLDVIEIHPNENFITHGFNAGIKNDVFGTNITYYKDRLDSVWFSWKGGATETKGYDITEKELIKDKNKLTKLMCAVLGKEPETRTCNHDTFLYSWGHISVSAALRSSMVTIGIVWTSIK